jgi:hypothetical protein
MKKWMTVWITTTLLACSKGPDPVPAPPPVPPVQTNKTCIVSGIAQRNSGNKAEFALSIGYNASLAATNINIFDSTANSSLFNATLTYAGTDSIRIDQYQYMKLDASKRVTVFVTKSDLNDIPNSDNYRYEYGYDIDGYLVTKNLFLNGSTKPGYTTSYSYSNGLLTGCVMKTGGSSGLKILEATLSYDATQSPKTMLYCFPDGFESYFYSVALNFGRRPANPLSQVVTKIYNPSNAALIDTWTTNYSGYILDANGYISSCTVSGDHQQGMAALYGKTYLSYQCQ